MGRMNQHREDDDDRRVADAGRKAREAAEQLLNRLNLTADERQFGLDIGADLYMLAERTLNDQQAKGYQLRHVAVGAALAYALHVAQGCDDLTRDMFGPDEPPAA